MCLCQISGGSVAQRSKKRLTADDGQAARTGDGYTKGGGGGHSRSVYTHRSANTNLSVYTHSPVVYYNVIHRIYTHIIIIYMHIYMQRSPCTRVTSTLYIYLRCIKKN